MASRPKTLSPYCAVVLSAIILLTLTAGASNAATTLKIKVPWDHAYLCWITPINVIFIDGHVKTQRVPSHVEAPVPSSVKAGALADAAPQRFKGKVGSIELPAVPAGITLFTVVVYDIPTGNEAVESVSLATAPKGLTLLKRDFDEVRRVRIKVTADHGKPVESAIVKLKDIAGHQQTAMIDPTTVGIAEFTDITSGDATVDVLYGEGKKASQTITIPDERDEPVFTTEFPVAGPVETVKEAKEAEEGAKTAKREKARKSGAEWIAALLGSVFGFLVLVGLVVAGYFYLKSRGATLQSSLKKMGVNLPEYEPEDQAAPPSAPAVDPNVCQFCGQRKDAQGNCACTIGAAPAPSGASTGPRLIGTQGSYAMSIFELTSDITTLGREMDNTIPLPNDTTVSRHHARIAREAGGYVAYDAGSSNGIFVNGDKVEQRAIQPGDEIQVGTTKFRFEV